MKVHLQDQRYGTLTGTDGKPLGRIACVNDQMQWLKLQSVRTNKRGVTCKRCLKMYYDTGHGKRR